MTSGRLKKEAYNHLSKTEISLLVFLLAFADQDGVVEIHHETIAHRAKLSVPEFNAAKQTLLSFFNINAISNAKEISTFFIGGMEAFCFKWDTRRLPESQWAKLRKKVFERDDFTCQYCGARGKPLECDHVLPISRGGPNEIDNLVTACKPCNQSKRNKTPTEWLQ